MHQVNLPFMLIVFCTVLSGQNVNSYRILVVFPHLARSHYIIGESFVKGLTAKGHDVTFVTPFKPTEPITAYKVVYLERSFTDTEKEKQGNFLHLNNIHFNTFLNGVYDWSANFTRSTIKSVNFQQFLQKKEHFDVVVHEIYVCDALIGLGHYFGAPVIGFSTLGPTKWTSDLTGMSDFASHNPNFYNGFTDQMNFWQRMYNSLSYWYEDFMLHWRYYPIQQKLFDELFRNESNMPTYSELRRKISLVFVNSHISYGVAQPMPPNLIEVGGIHVKTAVEPLTEDIQTFLDGATDGVIYLSLGSNLELAKLPQQQKRMIADAFSEFANYRLLIKCTEDFRIPSHDHRSVLIRHWFNQEAILSHPNLKVFVTHGGLLSTTEAVHFGKPVIGISVFYDQRLNMKLAQQKGYGIDVTYENLSEENLKSAIREMLTNSSYSETAKKISERFHDQLSTPMDRAIHWVEHVARHKGSLYMQSSGVHLPFHVYHNLDVWAFMISVVSVASFSIVKIIQMNCFPKSKRSNKEKLN